MQVRIASLTEEILPLRVFLLCGFLFLASCQTTQSGIGNSRSRKPNNEIAVYKIDYETGLRIARQICSTVFDQSVITKDGRGIRVSHDGNYVTQGTAGAFIYPKLVQNTENNAETGIMFKVESFGEGSNFSLVPGFMAKRFFRELDRVSKTKDLQTIHFRKYVILKDVGTVEKIATSIPTTFEGYKTHLDNKQNLHPFEGIWSLDDGGYKLGILYSPDDPQFKYKAFVLSTDRGKWKPGEIKARWNSLEAGDLCMGDWYAASKLKATMAFQVGKKLIMSVNAPDEYNGQIVLLKLYPTSASQNMERSGTGFAVSESGLIVTAYHVVKRAKTVKVYLTKDSFVSARVVHSNPANDLAVLKIERSTPSFLQVASMRSVKTGDRVFTVGFPVSSVLGQEPKYTEGVVSSLTGTKGAASFLQMTVPVQPGNSGGPLVNEKGEVVGIVTSTAAILPFIKETGTLPQNVNWAVKADYLRPMIELPKVEQKQLSREQLIAHVIKSTFLVEAE